MSNFATTVLQAASLSETLLNMYVSKKKKEICALYHLLLHQYGPNTGTGTCYKALYIISVLHESILKSQKQVSFFLLSF